MRYTEEMRNFIADNVKGITSKELAEKVSNEFGVSVTEKQMKGYMGNNRLTNGVDCRFKKGQVPHNKGEKGKWSEGCERSWFKKGHIPKNHRPVGSERLGSDGYWMIKVAEPNVWKLKHRLIYEEHYGPIPKGKIIIFLDGNKSNFEIENLMCITKGENAVLNHIGLRYDTTEATESGVALANYIKAVHAIKKRRGR